MSILPGFITILSYIGWGKGKFDQLLETFYRERLFKHRCSSFHVLCFFLFCMVIIYRQLSSSCHLVFGLSLFTFPFSHDLAVTREGYSWREDLR